VRLLYAQLIQDPRLPAFQLTCTHYESLHSHNVKARVCHPHGAQAQWHVL
jgi:GTP cyclohydrolase FolE2